MALPATLGRLSYKEGVPTMVRSLKKKKLNKKPKVPQKADGPSTLPLDPAKVWRPGVDVLQEDEELQCDPSAYDCLHSFSVDWPSLSFDILNDDLGFIRTEFPHTIYCISGTQADVASRNSIQIMRVSNISGKKKKLVPMQLEDDEMDSDSDSNDEEDDDNGSSKSPNLQVRSVAHQGCVNRIRSMSQEPHICATWGDNGFVQIWDLSAHRNSLAASDPSQSTGSVGVTRQAPLQIFNGHKDEGYALDWGHHGTRGMLITGDCKGCVHLWTPTSGGKWIVDNNPFTWHTASVEDLQWSPVEDNVFASCSVDGRVAIWDSRDKSHAKLYFKAHNADVNVISWNRLATCMMASGSDDGSFSIWDLRHIKGEESSPVAHFQYHKKPITSIEWSPHDMSTIAVSSADNQLTIWDLSLERDAEEEAEFKATVKDQANAPEDLPPQLLFVHQGQKDLKELHWHGQIPGLVMSTAADGFNIFMPSNLEKTLPNAS